MLSEPNSNHRLETHRLQTLGSFLNAQDSQRLRNSLTFPPNSSQEFPASPLGPSENGAGSGGTRSIRAPSCEVWRGLAKSGEPTVQHSPESPLHSPEFRWRCVRHAGGLSNLPRQDLGSSHSLLEFLIWDQRTCPCGLKALSNVQPAAIRGGHALTQELRTGF